MFKTRKLLALPLIAALGLFCVLGLAACGSADETADVQAAAEADFDLIKNCDEEFLSTVIDEDTEATFQELGISGSEFMMTYLDGFDYNISEVTVDGDVAHVNVAFTCKTYDQLMEAMEKATETVLADPDVYSYSEEELYAVVGKTIMDEIAAVEPVEGDTFTLDYVKNDGKWELDNTEENSNAIANHLIAAPAE